MQKIVLAGLPYVTNHGDTVLFESTEFLVEKTLENLSIEAEIERLDLHGYKKGLAELLGKVLNRLYNSAFGDLKKDHHSRYHYSIRKRIFSLILKRQFRDAIINASAIIVAGGGLVKYKYETFDYRLNLLVSEAEKLGIPIYFNAVGVEGYSETDIRCQELKRTLNSGNIKAISTRDNIDLLSNKYIEKPSIILKKVADSAFWSNEVYRIEKKSNSNIIGLGVVRGNIFKDNGLNITEEKLFGLWEDIIKKLDEKGIEWKLFTNGLEEDNKFMYSLLERVNRKSEYESITYIPKTPEELVEIISKFNKVIACRMHASIIAYSLNVPSVGLVWNDKIKMFGESIGYSERFITVDKIEPEYIVEKLIGIENSVKDEEFKNSYRETTFHEINDFLRKLNHNPSA